MGRNRSYVSDIATGFKEDFDRLLAEFAREKSLRFSVFSGKWKDIKFSEIFFNRQSDQECREV